MSFTKYKNLFIVTEVIGILLLAVFSGVIAEQNLRNWHGPGGSISTDLYIPSIMFACEKGFINVNPLEIPHLRAFLDFNEQTFASENIPQQFRKIDWDTYQQYHRYLLYSVGWVWWLFGVSWDVLRWFLVCLFILTVLIVYAIARVYLPAIFALVVGFFFSISQIPVIILPILRDFARAPFILAVLLILFCLVETKRTTFRFIVLCFLSGLTCGIGIGFRRDLLMFLLLSVFILLLLPKTENVPKIHIRFAGILIVLITFLIVSYPILQSFHKFGTLGWHDTLMGFGTDHDDLAGLKRTNYERISKYDDLLVSAMADVYSFYHKDINDYELYINKNPELQKWNLFLAYLYWFPADILTRIYSAIARTLDRIMTIGLPINPYRALLSFAILILFIAVDLRKGLCFALILLYTMTIQTLQFNFRHNFYLTFIPYLLYSLLLYWMLTGIYNLWKNRKNKLKDNIEKLQFICFRFVIISFTVVFFSIGILIVARQIQSYQVSQIYKSYHDAELIPLSFESIKTQDGTLYHIEKPLSLLFPEMYRVRPSFSINILVLDFYINKFPASFETIYDGINDFSKNLTIIHNQTDESSAPTWVRYFLPVYENMVDPKTNWNRFVGIKINEPDKLELRSAFKVCDVEKIPLYINYYFTKDELPELFQKIAPYSKNLINPCWKPYAVPQSKLVISEATKTFQSGDIKKASEMLKEAMEQEPFLMMYGLTLCELYEQLGDIEQTKSLYIQLISKYPHDLIPTIRFETFLNKLNIPTEEKQKIWGKITTEIPHCSMAWYQYAKGESDSNLAKEYLSKAIELNKDILLASPFSASFYDIKEIFTQSFRNETNPDNNLCPHIPLRQQLSYMLNSGVCLLDNKRIQEATTVLQFLQTISPDFYLVYLPLINCEIELPEKFFYAKKLISLTPYKIEPITLLEGLQTPTTYFSEQDWLDLWQNLETAIPDSPCILCGLGRAYEQLQKYPEAEQAYRQALKYKRKSKDCTQLAYYRLANLLNILGKKDNAIEVLKKATRLYPDNQAIQFLYNEINK